MKRGFPSQALKHNGSYAPQVSLGVIVVGHDDLWSLERGAFQSYDVSERAEDEDGWRILAIYMGEPQRVAAIMLFWRCRAKPKSAVEREATLKRSSVHYSIYATYIPIITHSVIVIKTPPTPTTYFDAGVVGVGLAAGWV